MQNPSAPVSIEGKFPPQRAVRLDAKHIVPIGRANLKAENKLVLTDDLGLPCDPMFYAKSNCRDCYGRGTLQTTRGMTPEEAAKLVGAGVRAQVIKEWQAKGIDMSEAANIEAVDREVDARLLRFAKTNKTSGNVFCGCAQNRYRKARAFVEAENQRLGIKPEQAEAQPVVSEEAAHVLALVGEQGPSKATETVFGIAPDGSVK